MAYSRIEVKPLAGAIGAEIVGVDLGAALANEVIDEVHRAFLDHQMIYFRHQRFSPAQQVAVARNFGKPAIYPFLKGLDGQPEVHEIIKTETDKKNFGGGWHSDTAYKERPDMGTLLYALDVPAAGGDTLFSSMYAAYEALSPGMKRLVEGLWAINNSDKGYKGGRAAQVSQLGGMGAAVVASAPVLEAEHPVVRTHPETGRKGLYVSRAHTLRFRDMTEEESAPLINFLADHAVRPEFTCRLRWEKGTFAIWDNRCTQHCALNDYQGHRRHMHRVTLEGERPA
ncbi:MAG: TauD/TfdA dioxygenase family protein [Hyphomicrobiaceae bacterium]